MCEKSPSDWCAVYGPPPPQKTAGLYAHRLWKLSQFKPVVHAFGHGNRGLDKLGLAEYEDDGREREKEDKGIEQRKVMVRESQNDGRGIYVCIYIVLLYKVQ